MNNLSIITLKSINKMILFILLITPIFTILDLMLQQGYSTISTPFYIKIIKDMAFLLITIISFIFILKNYKIQKIQLIFGSIIFIIIIMSLLKYNNIYMYLSGIRWIMPFLLAVILMKFIKKDLLVNIAYIIFILFTITLIFQIYEAFTVGNYYGQMRLNIISARTSGFYAYPTSLGFFLIVVFFVTYFYGKGKLRTITLYLIPFSILLANSKTAMVTYILILLIIKFYKKLDILIAFIPIVISVLFGLIYYFNHQSITQSFAARIGFFVDNTLNAGLIGSFGQATSIFQSLKGLINIELNVIYADSFIGALPVNIGFIGFIIFMCLYVFLLILSFRTSNLQFTIFLVIYGLFSLTMSITEAFPMNLLFSVFLAYYLNQYKIIDWKIKYHKNIENQGEL